MIELALTLQLASASVVQAASDPWDVSSPLVVKQDPAGHRTWREKALPAATSLVLPGVGQIWQGQVEKGIWHVALAASLWGLMTHAEAQQGNATGATGVGANVRAMSAWGLLALTLWSPLDAWLYGERDVAAPQARSSFLRK